MYGICMTAFEFSSIHHLIHIFLVRLKMINGRHLYSAFKQSTVQLMLLIHTHQPRLAAMQGTNQLVRSNCGFGVLLKDTSTHLGIEPAARRLLLPPEPSRLKKQAFSLEVLSNQSHGTLTIHNTLVSAGVSDFPLS